MTNKTKFEVVCLTLMLMLLVTSVAIGATKGDSTPKATNGAVSVLSTGATKVFTALLGRNALSVFNNGPNTIYCGWRSNVTTANGYPVPAAASLSVDLLG